MVTFEVVPPIGLDESPVATFAFTLSGNKTSIIILRFIPLVFLSSGSVDDCLYANFPLIAYVIASKFLTILFDSPLSFPGLLSESNGAVPSLIVILGFITSIWFSYSSLSALTNIYIPKDSNKNTTTPIIILYLNKKSLTVLITRPPYYSIHTN